MRINQSAVKFGAYKDGELVGVATTKDARSIASRWLKEHLAHAQVSFGLPEVDDRFAAWRVSLLDQATTHPVGELMITCIGGTIIRATDPELISRRLTPTIAISSINRDEPLREPQRQPTGTDIFLAMPGKS
jgi:hypothetical protein